MRRPRKYRVVVTTRRGVVKLARRRPNGTWSMRKGRANVTLPEARAGARWARNRGRARDVRVKRKHRSHLSRDSGVVWPTNKRLMRKLNTVGVRSKRLVHVRSGKRTAYEAWVLRMRYLSGNGNLAARCCSRYADYHSWASCGKDPWSNHADGNAADCGLLDRNGSYSSIGYSSRARRIMRRIGLCLPVPGEQWHVELGTTWRA